MKEKLVDLLKKSYAPYSNCHVASVVCMKDGKEFFGVNIENASYGATVCAERVAIYNAITNGYKKGDVSKIYIMNDTGKIWTPCMLCRQVFVEFFDVDTEIICMDLEGKIKNYKFNDLCLETFSKEDLK